MFSLLLLKCSIHDTWQDVQCPGGTLCFNFTWPGTGCFPRFYEDLRKRAPLKLMSKIETYGGSQNYTSESSFAAVQFAHDSSSRIVIHCDDRVTKALLFSARNHKIFDCSHG